MKNIKIERVYIFPDGSEKSENDMSAEEISSAEENIRNKLRERLNIKSDA